MKLTQFIDGVDGMVLKNYLFCQKNKIIVRENEMNEALRQYLDNLRSDASLIL